MRARTIFYIAALLTYLVLDSVWLTLTATSLYRATLGDILIAGFKPAPALAVYLLQVLGLTVFVMPRARQSGRAVSALGYGAAFGIFTYGLYDLTNDATLVHWTWQLTVTDMIWGAVISGFASFAGWLVAGRFTRTRIFS